MLVNIKKIPKIIAMLIPILISLVAFFVSWKSCSLSQDSNVIAKKANDIAETALECSRKYFVVENRPYLLIELVKHGDTDTYLKTRPEGDYVYIEIKYRVHNIGNTPAINVSGLKNSEFFNKDFAMDESSLSQPLPVISIGPAQEMYVNFELKLARKAGYKQSPSDFVKNINEGNQQFMAQMELQYQSDLNIERILKTAVVYEISIDRANLVKQIIE